ncbi:septal ring lytic transglycosylase RlpA family protein [Castellaniella sp.]|uniref:septal ring lytic transglycosylase RlpA family protein n=1 Tax=Castellaniella sp. TaxID=1955812 RepID=UPI002AFF97E7|nr:septal ring lytic transglycosylase RlpA family protein [Castellaniella sp.]
MTTTTLTIPPACPSQPPRPSFGRALMISGLCLLMAVLAGCASRSGGYYKDDGPGDRVPADIASIPDAVPRLERHAPANFRPYEVFGVRYIPISEDQPYRQEGIASWYGRKFHGEKTANGETYDMYAMTAAHPTLPIPSYAQVTSQVNGRSVVVRINDRGPFHPGRIIDLSYVAAAKLGLIGPGSGRVLVQAITNADIRAGRTPGAPLMASASPVAEPIQPQASLVSAPPAPAPAPAPAAMTATTATGGGIYLQFGAFSSLDNAQALAQRVNAQMDGSLGQVSVSHQPPLYKVRMGPFPSRDQAHQTASALSASAGMNPVIALDQGL